MATEKLTSEQIQVLQSGGDPGIADEELREALLTTLLYWRDRSRTLFVERAILRAWVDEAIEWFARATPSIVSAIAFQQIHNGTYDGPPAPEWMQAWVAEVAASG